MSARGSGGTPDARARARKLARDWRGRFITSGDAAKARGSQRVIPLPEWIVPRREADRRGTLEARSLELWCSACLGDLAAAQQLIEMHQGLVIRIAGEQSAGLSGALQDEHRSEGFAILCRVIWRWDPARGPMGKFLAYRLKMDLRKWRGKQAQRHSHFGEEPDDWDRQPELADERSSESASLDRLLDALEEVEMPHGLGAVKWLVFNGVCDERMIARQSGLGAKAVRQALAAIAQHLSEQGYGGSA